MPAPTTILAFDFGLRRIGVAVGQSVTGSASPLAVVANRETGVDHGAIAALIREWRPSRLVVGMPAHADGSDSEMQQPVLAFIDELRRYDLPITTVDERYTSVEAERVLREARAAGTRRWVATPRVGISVAIDRPLRFVASRGAG